MYYSKDISSENKTPPLNIVFLGESYLSGMAGSRRIQNIINPMLKSGGVIISNLIIANPQEKVNNQVTGQKNNVSYQIIKYSLSNPFSLIIFIYNAIKFISNNKLQTSKNILYCYDNPTILNIPILLFARIKKFKIVADIVEDYNLLDKTNFSLKQKIMISTKFFLLNKIHLYADAVFTISDYLKEHLIRVSKLKIPVYYLPITVDFSFFSNAFNSKDQVIRLFYGGSFGEKDGLHYFLQAFENLAKLHPDVQLILTGKPPKSGMQNVLNFIEKSDVKEKIHYLGYLNDLEYYQTMQQCDIFCMTRINSGFANAGFPFKLGEMLATGKPVLATNVGDVSRFLIHKENAVLIAPNSVEEMTNGLIYLIQYPDEAKKIGLKGKETALKYFDADRIATELKTFLIDLE